MAAKTKAAKKDRSETEKDRGGGSPSRVVGAVQQTNGHGGIQQAAGNLAEQRLARRADGTRTPYAGPDTRTSLSRAGRGQPLPGTLRGDMERAFGADLSRVRVHTDVGAVRATRELDAKAFTRGQDIFFDTGRYQPGVPHGKQLIAHELTHTLQQGQPCSTAGASPAMLRVSRPEDPQERTADAVAERVTAGQPVASEALVAPTSRAGNVIARQGNDTSTGVAGMPDPEKAMKREEKALRHLGGDLKARVQMNVGRREEGAIQSHHFEVTTTASGSRGRIATTTQIQVIYNPGDPTMTVLQPSGLRGPELGLGTPHDVPAYPVRILYNRIIKYTDTDGREVDVNVSGNVHFTHETWAEQLGDREPTFAALQQMKGDTGEIYVDLMGSSAIPDFAYYANYAAVGKSLSIQTGQAESMLPLGAGILGFSSGEPARFLDLDLPGGEQFASLRAFLVSADAIELQRRLRQAKEKESSAWYDRLFSWIGSSWMGQAVSRLGDFISDLWNSLPAPVRGVLSALAQVGIAVAAIVGLAAVIVALAPVELTIGAVALVIGGILLAAAFVSSLIARSKEAELAGEGGPLAVVLVALADAVGVGMVYESLTDESMLSGIRLDLSTEERWEKGTLGIIQTVATLFGVRAMLKRTRFYGKTTETADPSLSPGEGGTDPYGNIRYSPHGPATEQALVLHHERVHSFFSPRFKILRTLRAKLSMSAYEKSSLLRYVEEAMAETYAQWRVSGFKGIPEGVRFPIKNGYVYLTKAGSAPGFKPGGGRLGGLGIGQEVFLGTVVIGGVAYGAYAVVEEVSDGSKPKAPSNSPTAGAGP